MKTIKFIALVIYRMNIRNKTRTPYINTILLLTFFSIIHIFQFFLIINRTDLVSYFNENHRVKSFLTSCLFILTPFLFLLFFIPKSEFEKLHFDETEISKGNIYLVLYIILTILLLVLLILYRKG